MRLSAPHLFTGLLPLGALMVTHSTAIGQGPSPSDFRIVAVLGDPVPGRPGDQFVSFGTRPSINQVGRVLLSASTSLGPNALWLEDAGSNLVRVAGTGDPIPELPGLTLGSVGLTAVHNNLGAVAFGGTVAGPGVILLFNDGCVMVGTPGAMQLVARGAQARPNGARPGSFGSLTFATVALNDAGSIVFDDGYSTAGEYGIWRARWLQGGVAASTLAVVALAADTVCGTGGARYADLFNFGGFSARVNAAGDTLFRAPLVGPGVNDGNSECLVGGPITAPCLAIRAGSPAVGVPGANFAFFDIGPLQNDNGQVAFSGYTAGPERNGIWAGAMSALALIASDDAATPAPGANGARLSDLGAPFLSNAGRVAFAAELAGSGVNTLNNTGIWSNGSGVLRLIAREGSPAVGTTDLAFSDLELEFPCINARGEVVFTARTRTPAGQTSVSGVWAADRRGTLVPIAVPGMLIDINDAPGQVTLRTITSASTVAGSGGHDGLATALNDQGEVVVQVTYTGPQGVGSGVFVTTVPSGCVGDFNGVGGVTVQDIFDFLIAYFAGLPAADVNRAGGVTVQDIFDFLVSYFAGCP